MTDLQRPHDWHGSEGGELAKVLANGDKEKLTAVAYHAETARILSVLLRVREGCTIEHINEFSELTGLEIYSETCPERTLRDLAELLGGSNA